MWCVTKATVFGDWRMFPNIRPTFFGVTLKTGIVQCLTNQLRFGACPMRTVAASAIHLTFEKRMRIRFQCLAALQSMAVVTDLGLRRGLHDGIAWRMADVAICAGDFVVVVWPAVPAEADIRVVATKTHVILDTELGGLM